MQGPGRGWTRKQGAYRGNEREAGKRKRVKSGGGRPGVRHSGQPDSGTSVTTVGQREPRGWRWVGSPRQHWFKMRNSGRPPRRIGAAGKRGNAPLARETHQTRPLCVLAAGGKPARVLYSHESLQMDNFVCICGWTITATMWRPQQDQVGLAWRHVCAPRKARGVCSRCWSCRCRPPAGSSRPPPPAPPLWWRPWRWAARRRQVGVGNSLCLHCGRGQDRRRSASSSL